MNPAHARAIAILLGVGVLPIAGAVLTRPFGVSMRPATPVIESEAPVVADDGTIDSVTISASRSGAFRASRRPARQRFDARRAVAPSAPTAPRPVLVLTGIVWGREPAAVMEGLPGVEGSRVVRRGDIVNGITIRQVTRTTVSAAGLDTTWLLRVRESWR